MHLFIFLRECDLLANEDARFLDVILLFIINIPFTTGSLNKLAGYNVYKNKSVYHSIISRIRRNNKVYTNRIDSKCNLSMFFYHICEYS